MKKSMAFKSKYLRGADIEGDLELTINNCTMVQISPDDESPKAVLTFETGAPMVLNAINWDTIESMYGDETDQWRGRKIRLWFNPAIEYQGRRTGGIRVRGPGELPEGWSKSKNIPAKAADVDEASIPF